MTLREHHEPPLVSADTLQNVTDLLETRAAEDPQSIAFDVRHPDADPSDPWTPVTTAAFHRRVCSLAKGLIAAGIRPGDHVAICAATRYEWTLMDLAALYAGAVVVPLFDSAPASQMAHIVETVDVRLAIAGTQELAETLAEVLAGRDSAIGVWTMDPSGARCALLRGDLTDLAATGTNVPDPTLEAARTSRGLDEVATVVFTSGTTGKPKGARILHRSFVHQVLNVAAEYSGFVRPDGATVLFLPLAHVLSRGVQMVCLSRGMRVAHVAQPTQAVASLAQLHPTFLMVVPRVLEKIVEAAGAAAESKRLGRLWADAVALARKEGARRLGEATEPASGSQRLRLKLYDRLFFAALRSKLGGRIEYLLCGAAALNPDLTRFFTGAGIPVIEGYGLTETTAPATGNRLDDARPGTVGRPMPGMSVRISDEGEVLISGPGVFAGYVDPQETETSFEGTWLRTGDLGALDDDGRLTLTGRSRDVVVTSGGKTINPAGWERDVETHPAVGHAVVLGDGMPHPTAMILLDREALAAWLQKTLPDWQIPAGVAERLREGGEVLRERGEALRERGGELRGRGAATLRERREALKDRAAGRAAEASRMLEITEQRIRESVGAAIEAANARVPAPERLKSFTVLLPDARELAELLTPTQKLKRGALAEKIAHLLPGRR
jgi:long-chain acyl-CoA synthetase